MSPMEIVGAVLDAWEIGTGIGEIANDEVVQPYLDEQEFGSAPEVAEPYLDFINEYGDPAPVAEFIDEYLL